MTAVLPARRSGEDAVGPLQDRSDLGVVEHHHEDDVAAGGELRGCRRHMGPLPERCGGLLTDVAHRHGHAGPDQRGGQSGTHVPEPDDPDSQGPLTVLISGTWSDLPI